jgi:TatD DNase family protein
VPPALVDIGANLANKAFRADLDAVLSRASGAGVATIIATGTNVDVSRAVATLASAPRERPSPALYATAGIHPHHASALDATAVDALRALLARREVVAVGECGLDYDRNYSPPEAQRRAFEAQLELAADVKKPVFLHERAASGDFVAILARWRPRLAGGVVHCFTADGAALDRYLELDLHVGITGWICDDRRGTHLRELVKRIPAGRLLVETDAPYLLPRDMTGAPRDRRNEPAFLAHVASGVARSRGEPLEELARHTTSAARALFGLA